MAQEFVEVTEFPAVHLRRRLTPEEQAQIGDALDCRGTMEGLKRFDAIKHLLPERARQIAAQEMRLPELA